MSRTHTPREFPAHRIHPIPFGTGAVEEFHLPNGLTLLVWEDHLAPVAALQVWFRVGSAHEIPGKTGIAHFFEHLMFKGTRKHPEGEFDRLLEISGVYNNAATWLDWTYYQDNLPASKLPLVMELEADRMKGLRLTQKQLDTEREVVRNERRLHVDNDPEGLATEQLFLRHFGNHPYGHPTLGWKEDLDSLTRSECLDFYQTYYAPDNAVLAVTGDVKVAEVLDLVQQTFGRIPSGTPRPEVHPASFSSQGAEPLVLPAPVSAPRLLSMAPAPPLGAPGSIEALFLADILFEAEGAMLTSRLVDDRELATDLEGGYAGLQQGGFFEVNASIHPAVDWRFLLKEVDSLATRFLARGPSRREFTATRNRLKTSFMRVNRSQVTRAQNLGFYQTTLGSLHPFLSFPEQLEAVTPDSLVHWGRQIVDPALRTCVVLIPQEESTTDSAKKRKSRRVAS